MTKKMGLRSTQNFGIKSMLILPNMTESALKTTPKGGSLDNINLIILCTEHGA